ncbi:outer membrane beta-barrel protein [Vibrio sp.]|nr:outer membrane beta-barrel protein [Vibrio sp.]
MSGLSFAEEVEEEKELNKDKEYIWFKTDSGLEIIPVFETEFGNNDNVGRFSDGEEIISSSYTDVNPGIAFRSKRKGDFYFLKYQQFNRTYSESPADDFSDSFIDFDNFLHFSDKHRVAMRLQYAQSHEARGTEITESDELARAIDEVLTFDRTRFQTRYSYGARSANQVEAKIGYDAQEYTNYQDEIGGYEFQGTKYRDYTEYQLGGTFVWRALPRTRITTAIEMNDRSFNQARADSVRDYSELFYLGGIRWDISGKTKGQFELGIQSIDYTSDVRNDESNLSWRGNLQWTPLRHAFVSFETIQKSIDGENIEGRSTYLRSEFRLSWKHYWLDRFYTEVGTVQRDDEYTEYERQDSYSSNSFGVGYEFRRWVDLSAGMTMTTLDSQEEGGPGPSSYDQNTWFIKAELIY